MRGVKGSKIIKERTRLWQGDIYKNIVTGEVPKIRGLKKLACTANEILIDFNNEIGLYFSIGTDERMKYALKHINKLLKEF